MVFIKYLRLLFIFSIVFLITEKCYPQNPVPFQFQNNSTDFTDSEIYIGLLGDINDSVTVWVNFKENTATNLAVKKISAADNTMHKISSDWGYAPIFTRLSEIPNKTVYIPAITGCRFFIAFKSPLYIHFHATGGYAGPDIQNSNDPNNGIRFETIELSIGANGMWVNTTRVDSYQYPMGVEVSGKSGNTLTYDKVGELITHAAILQRWQSTFTGTEFAPCYINSGVWLNNTTGGIILQPSKIAQFKDNGVSKNYFQDYIDRIWKYCSKNELVVSLGERGIYRGKVDTMAVKKDTLKMVGSNGVLAYISGKPTTQEVIEGKGKIAEDVLATPDKAADKAFQAQFSAALNRGAIDLSVPVGQSQNWGDNSKYFITDIYNKYVWFFHQNDISYNSKTYAFAYDDAFDQSSTIQTTSPQKIRVTIGGFANMAPHVLSSVTLTPATAKIKTGINYKFSATGYDESLFPMIVSPVWSSNGGTIDNTGNFSATVAGNYTVTATVGNIVATASITVEQSTVSGCELTTKSADFRIDFSTDTTNPTFTFVPLQNNAGKSTLLLFYSKIPNNWANVGANTAKPNTALKITGNLNDKIYFYYVYSTDSGNKNSMDSNDSFTIGNCIKTGIETIYNKHHFEVFPNPANDNITVRLNEKTGCNNASIYNCSGVLLQKVPIALNQSELKLNLSDIQPGLYFIVLQGDITTESFKFTKK